jgi:hypothetical protein
MLNTIKLPASPLTEIILDAFPSGSYALAGLLRLMDIVETDRVPTAAVECRVQPRMLINPVFVQEHAQTPEKLMMLVMHELHHVLLGHTTLFPRNTRVQNFVFDAVINGIVCRMFSRAEYTAFFSDYYSAERFPECLLRPPPRWPAASSKDSINYLPALAGMDKAQSSRIIEVHAALYSDCGASYAEVFNLLPKLLLQRGKTGSENHNEAQEIDIAGIPLLGEHSEQTIADGQLEQHSPLLFDIVRELVEQWPQPPDPIKGRSLADILKTTQVKPAKVPSNRGILRALIRQVAGQRGSGHIRQMREVQTPGTSPLPALSRKTAVLQALGVEPLLYPHSVQWRRREPSGEQVHIYLDVSGSMEHIIKALYGAVLDCQAWVYPKVHLFSTKIADISLPELKLGKCISTGGTDIACVAEHMAQHKVSRALLMTDGWVGKPKGQHFETLSQSKLAVAYLGSSVNQTDLQSVANYTETLSKGVQQ